MDGSLAFAWALGGTGFDRVMDIAVMPGSEDVFFAVGGGQSIGVTAVGATMEFFVAKYSTIDG